MMLLIGDIQIGKRLRTLREATIAELMESIQKIGLQNPITVGSRPAKREGGGMDTVAFDLIAGQHRLEACRRLGWTEIEVNVAALSGDARVLWEIDENLCRADLSELERGEHLVRRKAIYEELYPQSKATTGAVLAQKRWGDAAENSSVASFAADTAEKIGITDRAIRMSINRAANIDEKVRDRIRDNPEIADSGVELDTLAKMDRADQRKAVALVESGQAAGIRDAKKLMEPKPPKIAPNFKPAEQVIEKQFQALISAWNKAGPEARERFLSQIDTPVADNTPALRAV